MHAWEIDQHIDLADAKRYPLNSKQLAAANLQCITETLSLPKSMISSSDELHQIIDDKLADLDREPQNVQVAVQEEYGVLVPS